MNTPGVNVALISCLLTIADVQLLFVAFWNLSLFDIIAALILVTKRQQNFKIGSNISSKSEKVLVVWNKTKKPMQFE